MYPMNEYSLLDLKKKNFPTIRSNTFKVFEIQKFFKKLKERPSQKELLKKL